MTLDEAIKHYEELAEVNEDIANNCDMDNWMNKAGCEERASDYRQLAEWLRELKERRAADVQHECIIDSEGYERCSHCNEHETGMRYFSFCPRCGVKLKH